MSAVAKLDDVAPPQDYRLVSAAAPSSDITLDPLCRGLYIGTGGDGDLDFRCVGSNADRVGMPVGAGVFLPGYFTVVLAATTASNIWAVY